MQWLAGVKRKDSRICRPARIEILRAIVHPRYPRPVRVGRTGGVTRAGRSVEPGPRPVRACEFSSPAPPASSVRSWSTACSSGATRSSASTTSTPTTRRASSGPTWRGALLDPRFRLVEADIRDAGRVEALLAEVRPDAVVHLAAAAGVRPSIERPGLYASVNVVGTTHLLDAACKLDPLPRFLYASSSSIYGDRTVAPFRETDPVDQPVSPYAASKLACELMAHAFHQIHGLPTTGLRFFTAYGPRNRPDLAISKFAGLIERGEEVPMFGDGTTRRDYTYVEDIADGVIRAVDRCSGLHLYNLGHSEPIELRTMIATLGQALGKVPRVRRLPEQPGDVRLTCADITRAAVELGYEPRTSFREGIEAFVSWYRSTASKGPPGPRG